ncbi:UNVERIFIED_CONTAM: polyprotein, partial [Sesamum radiatum]
ITSSSVDNLVEYSTIPEAAIVENTVPLISPYNLYRKRGSLPQGIRDLIASKKRMNQKEQVISSKMDHCSLPASTKEQYVTLSIPPDFISGWKAEGYTHLHLGAVRLVLSYHGRKGLPVTARIALLDTRFLEYEHAVIGTVLTTLNAGSIVVTFFPNFAVSLSDPHVASAFKSTSTDYGSQPNSIFGYGHPTPSVDRINGHFIWDVDPSMCDPECSCQEESDDDDDDYVWSDYESDEDDDFSSCDDSDDDYDEPDPDYRLSYRTSQPCMMFQYDTDFPPMERYVDSAQKYSSKPYVQNNVVDTEGKLKPLTQAEEVLNWQTTNARAQNRSLTTLDAKMDRVLSKVQTTESKVEGMENQLQKIYDNLVQKIQQLDRDLRFLIDQRDFGVEFNQKGRRSDD